MKKIIENEESSPNILCKHKLMFTHTDCKTLFQWTLHNPALTILSTKQNDWCLEPRALKDWDIYALYTYTLLH